MTIVSWSDLFEHRSNNKKKSFPAPARLCFDVKLKQNEREEIH